MLNAEAAPGMLPTTAADQCAQRPIDCAQMTPVMLETCAMEAEWTGQ
jgi:hypothetical protein